MSISITDQIKIKIEELLTIQGEINVLSASLSAASGSSGGPGSPKLPSGVSGSPKPPSGVSGSPKPPGPHSPVSSVSPSTGIPASLLKAIKKLPKITEDTCKEILDWYTQDKIYKAANILELIYDYSRDNYIDQESVKSCIRLASPKSFEYKNLPPAFKMSLDKFVSDWKKPAGDDDEFDPDS